VQATGSADGIFWYAVTVPGTGEVKFDYSSSDNQVAFSVWWPTKTEMVLSDLPPGAFNYISPASKTWSKSFDVPQKVYVRVNNTTKATWSFTLGCVADTPSVVNCSNVASAGKEGIEEKIINLGHETGEVVLEFEAYGVPDKFVVEWPIGNVVIDTGWRGMKTYAGVNYETLEDPPGTLVFPGGITEPGDGVASFTKSTASPEQAKVIVYGPVDGTAWEFTLKCPVSASNTLYQMTP
jgi:hypothetical protein